MRRGGHWMLHASWLGLACAEDAPAQSQGTTTELPAGDTTTTGGSDTTGAPEATSGGSSGNTGSSTSGPADDTAAATDETGNIPEGPVVRFVLLGDAGEGNTGQYMVADVVGQICEERGCEFALYLGDNFYENGVDSVSDVQFQDKFELPYADLDLPFYVVLGNHDYGEIVPAWEKGQYQVDYSEFSEKWILPNEMYAFPFAHITFIALDTNRLFWDNETNAQRDFVRGVLESSQSQIQIAFGHHPYISNGSHGNAGNYEGLAFPYIDGQFVKDFFDEEICGKVHVYFSGHDHAQQWFPQTCGTEFVVTGAGATTVALEHRDDNPPVYYESADAPGFAWVEVAGSTMTVAFYDLNGTLNHEGAIELRP